MPLDIPSIGLLTAKEASELCHKPVVDEAGNKIGEIEGFWLDASTLRVEYLAVKTGWLFGKTHVVPARNAFWNGDCVKVPSTIDLLREVPSFSTSGELSAVDKEEINSHYGQSVPSERITDLAEVRGDETRQQQDMQADPTSPDLPEATGPLPATQPAEVKRNLAASDLTQRPATESQAAAEKDDR
jgi:sporulation protein YlmC with PRC-barrel domain